MDYEKIKRVETLNCADRVNDYLALGWHIVTVYVTAYDVQPPGSNNQIVHFVMGWTEGEPKYPDVQLIGNYV